MSLFSRAFVFVARKFVEDATGSFANKVGEHVGEAIGKKLGKKIDPNHGDEKERGSSGQTP